MFNDGQKVVCVDADATNTHNIKQLVKGAIYTIRRVGTCCIIADVVEARPAFQGTQMVYLIEIERHFGCQYCLKESPFSAARFRPITERKTDISELKKLCEPTPAKSVEVVR